MFCEYFGNVVYATEISSICPYGEISRNETVPCKILHFIVYVSCMKPTEKARPPTETRIHYCLHVPLPHATRQAANVDVLQLYASFLPANGDSASLRRQKQAATVLSMLSFNALRCVFDAVYQRQLSRSTCDAHPNCRCFHPETNLTLT